MGIRRYSPAVLTLLVVFVSCQNGPQDGVLLPAPEDIEAISLSTTTIRISWLPVTGAEGYNVNRSTSASSLFTCINAVIVTDSHYDDTALESNTEYWYRVAAIKNSTEQELSGACSGFTQPEAPSNIAVEAVAVGTLRVSWDAVAGEATYNVYRSDSSGGIFTKVSSIPITDTHYDDSGLQGMRTYWYSVQAVGTVEAGGLSAGISGTTIPDIAFDSSGNAIDATVYGPTLVADRFGIENRAYTFDGIDDYIQAAADQLPTAERTVSLWFFARSVSTKPGLIGYGGETTGTSWIQNLNEEDSGTYRISCHWGVNRLEYEYLVEPVDRWVHWVVCTDVAGTRMYIDDIEVASNLTYIDNTYVFEKVLVFGVVVNEWGAGTGADPQTGFLDGSLDDIRIYNRALLLSEISALFQEGTGASAPSIPRDGLVGEWLFSSGT